jgi:predicted branched-subunit amino acid permease
VNQLSACLSHPQFRAGIKEMASIIPGISAWGLVTGVAMVKSGMSVPLALFMTFTVFAGGVQLVSLPLIAAGAPMWVIWATAFCVNLRFVIFSIQMRPFFVRFPFRYRLMLGYFTADLTYVLFQRRFKEPRVGEGQIEYFLGGTTVNWFSWQISSVLGIVLSDAIPTHWGLQFAGVLALLGLTCSLLTDRIRWVAAVVAGGAAVAAFALPLRLNILVAIVAAVCAALVMEAAESREPS